MTAAEWIAKHRRKRIRLRLCIQCGAPVFVRDDGAPARKCERHLDHDADRAIALRARQATA